MSVHFFFDFFPLNSDSWSDGTLTTIINIKISSSLLPVKKPISIKGCYAFFGKRGLETKIVEFDVNQLQSFIDLKHLKYFEIIDGEGHQTIFTLRLYDPFYSHDSSIILIPITHPDNSEALVEMVNSFFRSTWQHSRKFPHIYDKQELFIIEIINNLYNLHMRKIDNIRPHCH